MRFVLLCLIAFPAIADDGRFPLTGIRVNGLNRVSEQLILAQAGLQVGGSYSERDLALARRRLMRLPHLLTADFYLEKGSRYGHYLLVIEVVEVKSLFYHYTFEGRSRTHDSDVAVGPQAPLEEEADQQGVLTLGARGFWGPFWSWYAGTELAQDGGEVGLSEGRPVDLGLTHRNLFKRRVFFNLNVQFSRGREGSFHDPYLGELLRFDRQNLVAPTLTLALPLRKQQWLSLVLGYHGETYEFGDDRFALTDKVRERRWRGNLSWFRDTTDDLALPRSGNRMEVVLSSVRVDSDFSVRLAQSGVGLDSIYDFETVLGLLPSEIKPLAIGDSGADGGEGKPILSGGAHARGLDLSLAGALYRPLTTSWTAFGLLSFGRRLSEQGALIRDADLRRLFLRTGVDYDLLRLLGRRPFDDLRLSFEAHFEYRRTRFVDERTNRLQVGLAWRQRWGLSRLSFRYEHLEQVVFPIEKFAP